MGELRTLKIGLRGPDVVRWQRFLEIDDDGIFGPGTRDATKAFQKKNDLKPDGIVGTNTFRKASAAGFEAIRRLADAEVTPDITANAKAILKKHFRDPFGTEVAFESAGKSYIARIEEHYHPPGGALKPWGPHTGVSVLVVETAAAPKILDDGLQTEDETLDLVPDNVEKPRFHLSERSLSRLKGVHEDLVRVVERAIAITPIDFTVLEGLRSIERQRQLVAAGSSLTLNSRHLTGHAVDIAPLEGGEVSWAWPLYNRLEVHIKAAAEEQGVPVEWGGDWTKFRDGPHWQLPWDKYPI